jgi:hypothetical protein
MEGQYKAVVRLPYQSGLPEDIAVNDFYFVADDATQTMVQDTDSLQTRITAFYNSVPSGGTQAIGKYIGLQVLRTTGVCKVMYYFSGPSISPPTDWGTPVRTLSWTLTAALVASGMPAEVAVCLSFHADLTDVPETEVNPSPPPAIIRPASHRRGRVYFGPCYTGLISNEGANQDARITSSVRTNFAMAMKALHTANDSRTWAIQSKAADSFFEVEGGYCDDAFDTQRRRGSAPGARTLWP